MTDRIHVLYIVYWGAAEPLGQSLVIPAVELLATATDITLITYEKPCDLANRDAIERIRRRFRQANIEWIPLRYHKWPRVPATSFDVLHGVVRALAIGLRKRPTIVHGRTFIGAIIGSIVAMTLRRPFVHHNEGFYPDEQVDGGVWRFGSPPHRIARAIERWLYERADAILCMSRRSKEVLETFQAVAHKRTPVVVVPSCVDLDHFKLRPPTERHKPLRLIYIGSVGNRYIVDKLARFVRIAGEATAGEVHLRVLTRSERAFVARMLQSGGLRENQWSLDEVPHENIPAELAEADAGLFFLRQGISEFACSPTKIGEYWATGIPVVTTAGVSDTDDIIHEENVGVIISEHTDDAYRRAAAQLQELLHDAQLDVRCRRAAERYYALAPFCDQQIALYARLTAHAGRERFDVLA